MASSISSSWALMLSISLTVLGRLLIRDIGLPVGACLLTSTGVTGLHCLCPSLPAACHPALPPCWAVLGL